MISVFAIRNKIITIRGQTPSSMGESFFFSCTRHVSMYLRRGIVIHSFFLSVPRHGGFFLLVGEVSTDQ